MWVTKLLISPVKKGFFAQNDQIWPKIGIFGQFGPGHGGLFSALLVGSIFNIQCLHVGFVYRDIIADSLIAGGDYMVGGYNQTIEIDESMFGMYI